MGLIRKVLSTGLNAGLITVGCGVGYLHATTTLITPLRQDDSLLKLDLLRQLNHYNNPVMSDLCIKRIPLSKIRPELRDDEAALGTEFCRAVWSGWAHTPQRSILMRLFKSPETANQKFTKAELASSNYDLGDQFADHFEVMSRTSTDVVVRAGSSPRETGPREMDGLLVTRVRIDRAAGVAEVGLGTTFFRGNEKITDGKMPIPYPLEVLHRYYSRALVLSGSQGLK